MQADSQLCILSFIHLACWAVGEVLALLAFNLNNEQLGYLSVTGNLDQALFEQFAIYIGDPTVAYGILDALSQEEKVSGCSRPEDQHQSHAADVNLHIKLQPLQRLVQKAS